MTESHVPPGNTLADDNRRTIETDTDHIGNLHRLLARIREEKSYNIAKGESAYRLGVHDALRFSEHAVMDLLADCGEPIEPAEEPAWDA